MKIIRVLFFLILVFPQIVKASSAGAEPFNFLFMDANARAVALSGAYSSLATDANALLYNPAGLAGIKKHNATFMHNQYFQDITQEYLGYASPIGWGGSVNYLNYGSIKNTTISNQAGTGLGDFNANDLALSLGYGYKLTDKLYVGGAVKFIRETIDNVSGEGFGIDLGVLYALRSIKGLCLSGVIQNLGPAIKFESETEDMPLAIRIGSAYAFRQNTISIDLMKERSEDFLFAIGMERIFNESFPVRLGYNTRNDDGPGITAGMGYLYNNLSFDYAFVPFRELGSTHRLSVTMLWGQKAPKATSKQIETVVSSITVINKPEEDTAIVDAIENVKKSSGIEIKEGGNPQETYITATEKAIYFDSERHELKKDIYPLLDKIADLILVMKSKKVEVYGHTDNKGDTAFNRKLSTNRAQAVVDYFVNNKILPRDIFYGLGYGSTTPIATNNTEEGRAKNRRVEIIIHK
ncbi:MAG: PorV/PorQ family protein [Candidatus Omnitrophica bacterium]|nr:PorV/PorQ family protein [Candidatus Omnitrophota bacterium]